MHSVNDHLLIINGGSSSIKFAIYATQPVPAPILEGALESIGSGHAKLHFHQHQVNKSESITIGAIDFDGAVKYLIRWFAGRDEFSGVCAAGHRLVYGMKHAAAERITPALLDELHKNAPYDPEHLPTEIKLIRAVADGHPALLQVACFDAAFHNTMPRVANLLPIPRKYYDMNIRRYGFHGLSYSYLAQQLNIIESNTAAKRKVILAHLGNGASLAAIKDGKSIDTTMGLTPASGLVMSTRTGDIDPGVAWYLMKIKKMSYQQFNYMINHESGLLGVSETTSDMRELVRRKNTDPRAADAFELFCYQTKKFIGAYAAVLEGLDTLVFSGGIGEHLPEVRDRICDGLGFLGLELDHIKNTNNDAIISTASSHITVRIIPTDEQLMMAGLVSSVLHHSSKR